MGVGLPVAGLVVVAALPLLHREGGHQRQVLWVGLLCEPAQYRGGLSPMLRDRFKIA